MQNGCFYLYHNAYGVIIYKLIDLSHYNLRKQKIGYVGYVFSGCNGAYE